MKKLSSRFRQAATACALVVVVDYNGCLSGSSSLVLAAIGTYTRTHTHHSLSSPSVCTSTSLKVRSASREALAGW